MTVDAPAPGTVLRGKYRVERVLGSGGMGVVLAATHLRLGGLVAIKMLRPEARGREEIVRRFAREARAASRLRGEHAVRVLDVDDSEAGDPFLVMEHLDGRDLQRVLAEDGALPPAIAAEYVLQACEGIAEAHASGIVHRDLKPANLFVAKRPDQSRLLKILDFGISKAAEPENHDAIITRAHIAMGSPSYMSPEHLKNAADVDARADIWSLGVVLYQLLANGLPFEADTTAAIVARIAADPPAPLRARCPDVPLELEAVVLKCLAKDPSARYASVAELARALSSFGLRGESSAERVARVLDAGPPVSRSLSAAPIAPVAPPAPAATGAGTASVVAPIGSPLAQAMGTEYGSSLGTTPPADEPPRRGSRLVRGAIVAAGVGLVGAIAVLSRHPSPPPAAAPATADPPPSVATTDPPPARPSASASEAAPAPKPPRVAMPRPPRSAAPPASGGAPPAKNPLNIDFR